MKNAVRRHHARYLTTARQRPVSTGLSRPTAAPEAAHEPSRFKTKDQARNGPVRTSTPVRPAKTSSTSVHLQRPPRTRFEPEPQASRQPTTPWNAHEAPIWNPQLDTKNYGPQTELRRLLNRARHISDPTVFVSLDTEKSRAGIIGQVTEIGLSILDTRDLRGEPAGHLASNWIRRIKSRHYLIEPDEETVENNPHKRTWKSPFMFGDSEVVLPVEAREGMVSLLQSVATKTTATKEDGLPFEASSIAISTRPRFVLVGHSIFTDIRTMYNCPSLLFDITAPPVPPFSRTFDTAHLARVSGPPGAVFETNRLDSVVKELGLASKYARRDGGIKGWHNAGNDAHYAMMALLLFATRQQDRTIGGNKAAY